MEDDLPSPAVGEKRALAWEQLEEERRAWVLLVLQRVGLATVEKKEKKKRVFSLKKQAQNKTNLQMYYEVSKLTGVNFI